MFLRASAVSHVGNVREHNEDNYCFLKRINNLNENGKVYQISRSIFNTCFMGVFDGMGGISAGEKASFIAANTARDMMPIKNMSPDEAMIKVCDTANSAICREMQSTKKRMGTTAAMLCFDKYNFYVCNIGDSPVFILRKNKLKKISTEHTEKSEYESKTGQKAPKGKKFKLTQYLGIFSHECCIAPYTYSGKLSVGDKFLICSDGLTDVVTKKQIKEIMNKDCSIKEIAEQLLNMALDNGSQDNITVICAELKKSIFS